jgi:hypothetical protein
MIDADQTTEPEPPQVEVILAMPGYSATIKAQVGLGEAMDWALRGLAETRRIGLGNGDQQPGQYA